MPADWEEFDAARVGRRLDSMDAKITEIFALLRRREDGEREDSEREDSECEDSERDTPPELVRGNDLEWFEIPLVVMLVSVAVLYMYGWYAGWMLFAK